MADFGTMTWLNPAPRSGNLTDNTAGQDRRPDRFLAWFYGFWRGSWYSRISGSRGFMVK